MFTRLAKFQRFQGFGLRRVTPPWPEAVQANDNLRGRRLPAGQHRSPLLRPACHWVLVGGSRLECRWNVGTSTGEKGISP
jgi:hypothetical protein